MDLFGLKMSKQMPCLGFLWSFLELFGSVSGGFSVYRLNPILGYFKDFNKKNHIKNHIKKKVTGQFYPILYFF
jgi:hypothetical protein